MSKHLKPIPQSDRDALRGVPGVGEELTARPLTGTITVSLSPRLAEIIVRGLGLIVFDSWASEADQSEARYLRVYLERRLAGGQ